MRKTLFSLAQWGVLAAMLPLLAGCPPEAQKTPVVQGAGPNTYIAENNKLFDQDAPFDIRWDVVYPKVKEFDPSTAVSNRELAIQRCTRCHECGFPAAFDLARYGQMSWEPRLKGTDWSMPIQRMMTKENNFLNDYISERIYSFLRDETLGRYDETKDEKGAVIREVDELPVAAPPPAATT